MELAHTGKRLSTFVKKYRYVLLILVLGIVLMLLPDRDQEETMPAEPIGVTTQYDMTEDLTNILAQIQGAGRIKVLLTGDVGEEIIYQTDHQIVSEDGRRSEDQTTLKTLNSDRSETGLVRQIIAPKYRGAVVVCQGADQPQVRLAIIEAVSDATGLGTDKISVLKMK